MAFCHLYTKHYEAQGHLSELFEYMEIRLNNIFSAANVFDFRGITKTLKRQLEM